MPVSHVFSCTIADDAGAAAAGEVLPSHWNSAHSLTLGADEVIKFVSAGTQSVSSGTIVFANSNGVTFGMDAGTVTGSHNGLTTAALSNHSHGDPTLALTNLSGTTASASNGFTLSLSAAAPGAGGAPTVSAGTTSDALQTIVFANSNRVSFGLNGSTLTATVGSDPNEWLIPIKPHGGTSTLSMAQTSLFLQPFEADAYSGCRAERIVSMAFGQHTRTGTASITTSQTTTASATTTSSLGNSNVWGFTRSVGFYSQETGASSTRMTLYTSGSASGSAGQSYNYSYAATASHSTNFTYTARASATQTIQWGYIGAIDTAGGITTSSSSASSSQTASATTTQTTTITTSTSISIAHTASSLLTGLKVLDIPMPMQLSDGPWWYAEIQSTSSASTGSNMTVATMSNMNLTTQTSAYWPFGHTTTNKSNMMYPGQGVMSVGTAAFPATIAYSDISAQSNIQYFFALRGRSL